MFVEVGTQSETSQGSYDVQTLKPSGDNVPNGRTCTAGTDVITLQKLSATGGAGSQVLFWRDSKGETWVDGRQSAKYYGWYGAKTQTTPYAGFTVAPGEGLWVNCPNVTTGICFPSVLPAAE